GVVHVTEYRYPEPAWDSFNEVRLSPTDDHAQSLLSFELELSPEATVRSHLDYYGNRAHQFHIAEAHRRLAIEARSSVVTYPRPAPVEVAADSLAELKPRFFEFLAPTPRVPLEQDWGAAMRAPALAPDGDLFEYLARLTRHLHDFFTYRPNVTEIDTPMAEFVRARAGVCQDYTHVMLALCRRIGIPARYVSGYLETGAGLTLGSDASPAWCYQANMPDMVIREYLDDFLRTEANQAGRAGMPEFIMREFREFLTAACRPTRLPRCAPSAAPPTESRGGLKRDGWSASRQ